MSRDEAREKARKKAAETKIAQEAAEKSAFEAKVKELNEELQIKMEANKAKSKLVLKNTMNDLVKFSYLYNEIQNTEQSIKNLEVVTQEEVDADTTGELKVVTQDEINQFSSKVNEFINLVNKLSKITFGGKAFQIPNPSEQVDAKFVMQAHYFSESSDFSNAVKTFCTKMDAITCDQDSIVQIIGDADYCC